MSSHQTREIFILKTVIANFIPAFSMGTLWKAFERVRDVSSVLDKMTQRSTGLGTELEAATDKQGGHLCQ